MLEPYGAQAAHFTHPHIQPREAEAFLLGYNLVSSVSSWRKPAVRGQGPPQLRLLNCPLRPPARCPGQSRTTGSPHQPGLVTADIRQTGSEMCSRPGLHAVSRWWLPSQRAPHTWGLPHWGAGSLSGPALQGGPRAGPGNGRREEGRQAGRHSELRGTENELLDSSTRSTPGCPTPAPGMKPPSPGTAQWAEQSDGPMVTFQ